MPGIIWSEGYHSPFTVLTSMVSGTYKVEHGFLSIVASVNEQTGEDEYSYPVHFNTALSDWYAGEEPTYPWPNSPIEVVDDPSDNGDRFWYVYGVLGSGKVWPSEKPLNLGQTLGPGSAGSSKSPVNALIQYDLDPQSYTGLMRLCAQAKFSSRDIVKDLADSRMPELDPRYDGIVRFCDEAITDTVAGLIYWRLNVDKVTGAVTGARLKWPEKYLSLAEVVHSGRAGQVELEPLGRGIYESALLTTLKADTEAPLVNVCDSSGVLEGFRYRSQYLNGGAWLDETLHIEDGYPLFTFQDWDYTRSRLLTGAGIYTTTWHPLRDKFDNLYGSEARYLNSCSMQLIDRRDGGSGYPGYVLTMEFYYLFGFTLDGQPVGTSDIGVWDSYLCKQQASSWNNAISGTIYYPAALFYRKIEKTGSRSYTEAISALTPDAGAGAAKSLSITATQTTSWGVTGTIHSGFAAAGSAYVTRITRLNTMYTENTLLGTRWNYFDCTSSDCQNNSCRYTLDDSLKTISYGYAMSLFRTSRAREVLFEAGYRTYYTGGGTTLPFWEQVNTTPDNPIASYIWCWRPEGYRAAPVSYIEFGILSTSGEVVAGLDDSATVNLLFGIARSGGTVAVEDFPLVMTGSADGTCMLKNKDKNLGINTVYYRNGLPYYDNTFGLTDLVGCFVGYS